MGHFEKHNDKNLFQMNFQEDLVIFYRYMYMYTTVDPRYKEVGYNKTLL